LWPSRSLVEQLSEKPGELGWLCTGGGVPARLVGEAVLHQDGACPSGAGLQSFYTELEPGRA
jgi:hypothetical protein